MQNSTTKMHMLMLGYLSSIFCLLSQSERLYLLHSTHYNVANLGRILTTKRVHYNQLVCYLNRSHYCCSNMVAHLVCPMSTQLLKEYFINPYSEVMRSPGTTRLSVSQSIIQWPICMRQMSLSSCIANNYNYRYTYRYFLKMMQAGKQNRMSRVSLPQLEGGTLEEYMEVLYAHQKNCEKTGKYMQAQTAKRRLVKVKEQLQKQRKEELLIRFEEEKRQVEMAHLEEITQFNKYWDEKMHQYQTEAERMEGESIDRHEKELTEFQQEIQASLCQGRRETGEIINLRKIEENLAKQEKYIEAHKVQRQIQALEKTEFQKWNHAKSGKMKNLMSQLRSKQQNELNALRQKIEQGFQQQKKTRQTQQEKLIQKYQNFMKQLENQHHQEIIKFQKSTKLQSTINFSRTSNMSRALQNRNN